MNLTDNTKTAIHAIVLISIGVLLGILMRSHLAELQRQNDELMLVNVMLLDENKNLRWCVPRKSGKAVITMVKDRPFCEVHNRV